MASDASEGRVAPRITPCRHATDAANSSHCAMTDSNSPTRRFEPLHRAHAIEQVVLGVQLAREVNDADFTEADQELQRLPTAQWKRTELQTFAVAFGLMPVAPPSGGLSGYLYQKTQSDGSVAAELRLDRIAVTFRTTLYTRWDEVWAEARSYIERILPSFVRSAPLAAVSLTYVDKFIWNGPLQAAKPSALLRLDSPYLTPHIFDQENLWHSHTGAFLRYDDQTKRLMNVNINCTDEARAGGVARVVTITTVLSDMLNQPGYNASALDPDDVTTFIHTHLNALHDFDKAILRKILTAEMSRRIALEG